MGAPIIDVDESLRLLGTAHVATASVEAVKQNIEEWKPDIVAVELCKSRFEALTQDRRLDKEGLLKVIKEGKAPMVLLQSLLAAEQRKLGIDEGQQPGAELLAAVEAAQEYDLDVKLVDRDIQTTLRRAWKKMGFKEKVGLMWALLAEEDTDEELELEDMLADKDLLTSLMEELREVSPGAGEVLIDERDEFIARKISGIRSDGKVLAVLGAGHLDGVSKLLAENVKPNEDRISELALVPKGGKILKTISYAIPIAVFALLGWFAYNGDLASIKEIKSEIKKENIKIDKVSGTEVPSPIIGTAYLAPEPGGKKFVEVGKKINKGDTIMIVEAMKTMNHVPSPIAGTVKKICVEDGQPVEYGHTIAIIE